MTALGLADAELDSWVSAIRSEPPTELSMRGVTKMRAPRLRSPGPDLALVADLIIPSAVAVPARLYRSSDDDKPLIIYAHGGAFVSGGLDSHDRACRRLALLADAAVLAVDYRLAPEHPAQAGLDDVVAAAMWAATRPPELGRITSSIALAGDSSGGLLAYLACARLQDSDAGISALLLLCPNADLTLSKPSIEAEGSGWGLSSSALKWFVSQWVPELTEDLLAQFSPLHTPPVKLPATIIATAEHDPLRDEGTELAKKLSDAGTKVDLVPHPGLVHGFVNLDDVSPAAREAGDSLFRKFGALLSGLT